jgi:GNAT superfamily N-acetyltransferase
VEIRAAVADEVDVVVASYDWLFAPPGSKPPMWDPDAAAERLRSAIASEGAQVLVADVDGKIAGFCTVYDEFESVRFGHRAWIEDLAVDPEQRSRRIGKALLDAAKDWARDRGATHLELDSAETRPDAHRFYEREGPSWRSVSFGWEL